MYYVLLSEGDLEDDPYDYGKTSHDIECDMYIVESVLCSLTLPPGITDPGLSALGR